MKGEHRPKVFWAPSLLLPQTMPPILSSSCDRQELSPQSYWPLSSAEGTPCGSTRASQMTPTELFPTFALPFIPFSHRPSTTQYSLGVRRARSGLKSSFVYLFPRPRPLNGDTYGAIHNTAPFTWIGIALPAHARLTHAQVCSKRGGSCLARRNTCDRLTAHRAKADRNTP